MLKCEANVLKPLLMGMLLASLAMPAAAFDINAGVTKESGPFDLFKFGFKAYKNGNKGEAVEAYRYAAERAIPARAGRLPICMPMAMASPRMTSKLSRSTAKSPIRAWSRVRRYGLLRQCAAFPC